MGLRSIWPTGSPHDLLGQHVGVQASMPKAVAEAQDHRTGYRLRS